MKKILLIIIIVFVGLSAYVYGQSQDADKARELYLQARKLQADKDFSNAYYTYSKISKGYKAYPVVLFQQANCAAALGDEKTVIEKFRAIVNLYPDTPLAPIASYSIGQAFIRLNQPDEAEKQFLTTSKKYPDTDYALGSLYYIGELNQKKNKDLAIQSWLKYIQLAPDGRFATESMNGLKSLDYKPAEKDIWQYNILHAGNKNEKQALLSRAIKFYLSNSLGKQKIQSVMLAYVSLSSDPMEKSWQNILDWTTKERDFAMYRRAQLVPISRAIRLYETIYKHYPHGDFASDALWNLIWAEYNTGSYRNALELAYKHTTSYENTKASPAVRFWMGKTYEKLNDIGKAKEFYNTVIQKYPDSYYAFRATGRLQAMNSGNDPGWNTNPNSRLPFITEKPEMPNTIEEIRQRHGNNAAEMMLVNDYESAILFIKNDPYLESWIKLHNNRLSSSIVSARNAIFKEINKPDVNDTRWKLVYPMYYTDQINRNALVNTLDPILVLALLKEESYFNPYAVSSSNAHGLMQLLPGTASDVIRWKGYPVSYKSQLFSPDVNIKLGTAYIAHTRDTFNGNMLFSVAAYNGGPGAVQTWLKNYPETDMDKFIENIPFVQTRDYVKKVFGSYWNYKRIYGIS